MYFTLFLNLVIFKPISPACRELEFVPFAQSICVLSFPKEYEATRDARGPALLTLVAGFFPVP